MIQRKDLTHAIADMLTANTTFKFDTVAPNPLTYPYGLIYPIGGTTFATSFTTASQIADSPYQVTCVGQNYDQTEALMDMVRKFILDNESYELVVANSTMTIMGRFPNAGPTEPRYVKGQDICSIAERFTISVDAP